MIPGRNTHFMFWVRRRLLSLLMCETEKRSKEKEEEMEEEEEEEEEEVCLTRVRLSFPSDQQAPHAAEPRTSRARLEMSFGVGCACFLHLQLGHCSSLMGSILLQT
ncbi:unnamed protein product [Pleuronectes platessa]|uniref:Uncharacterized protein n=1 Tax=Pleuronectes platessa TaxID=8262 RepID=A0A9N7VM27_PLEPL|nr:unnamed protein product [Pleuronectes platessa]